MAGKRGITNRGIKWELMNSCWVLFSLVALSWVGFLIIGKKARQKKWLIMGGIFFVLQFVAFWVLGGISSGAVATALSLIWLGAYVGGIILSILSRKKYLVCLDVLQSSGAIVNRDQQLRESVMQSYRQQGVEIAPAPVAVPTTSAAITEAVKSALQPQASAKLLDINSCSDGELSELPGVSVVLAKKLTQYREAHNGFSSVEEFYEAAALQPHFVAQLDGMLSCGPYTQAGVFRQETAGAEGTTEKRGRKLDF